MEDRFAAKTPFGAAASFASIMGQISPAKRARGPICSLDRVRLGGMLQIISESDPTTIGNRRKKAGKAAFGRNQTYGF